MFCREQAALYNEKLHEFSKRNANVIAIGNGSATMARDFVDRFGIRFDVYTDPDRNSYRAAGLKRGTKLNLGLLKAAGRALTGGHLQGRVRGNPNQQGGVLVVGPDETVLFSHTDMNPGDHARIEDVLAAVPK